MQKHIELSTDNSGVKTSQFDPRAKIKRFTVDYSRASANLGSEYWESNDPESNQSLMPNSEDEMLFEWEKAA